ncbi:MAG: NUDIX hydrolase [Methylobacillus sp.]|jgi:ADP-ribose pyrophosphatase|nr:NUDIX hydrolase [Methylobacillus sp.]
MSDKLTETCISSETVFQGRLAHVKRDVVRLPDGGETTREYLIHPGAVLIIPMLDDGRLVFERQFRYPLHQTFIELPAGKIDPDEDPLKTGQRELQEETGYTATDWRYLATFHPCIGYSSERILIYLATGLKPGKHQRDSDESLEIFTMTLSEAMTAMQRGEITDGKTMIALFWVEKYLAKEKGA